LYLGTLVPWYLGIIFIFFFSVITHRYVRDSTVGTKFDDKCLIFDFAFLQSISNSTFVEEYMTKLRGFISLLNESPKTGN